ncbi:MAG TPA: universal stress protein [Dissulfurispiraceae bacterium]|nr:universal stress protein [Dissulfurispiraceae bacterium]
MRMLLATDGSEHAGRAAAFLASLPLTQDDEILILHDINRFPVYDEKETIFIDFKELKQDIATRILDETVTILKPVLAKISTTVREGFPDQTIVAAAAETSADLIVMGARGIGRFRRHLIGSVTRSVAINTTKPLLVIKQHERKEPDIFRIVFATDGSDSCLSAAQFLNSLPLPGHVEITVVHVVWSASADIPDRFVLEIDGRMKEELARIRKSEFAKAENIVVQFERILSSRFQGVKDVIKTGNPPEELLAEAKSRGADLVVVGCRGLRGIKGMMGSVSRQIVSDAHCSVLIGNTCRTPEPRDVYIISAPL